MRLKPRQRRSTAALRGDQGFTLIETVALMAITGLLLAVALPSLPAAVSRPQIEGLAIAIGAILAADHRAAMLGQRQVASTIDAARRMVASGAGGRVLTLPDGVAIETALARTCLDAPVHDAIVFLPDGTSCGGRLALTRAGQRIDIRVNWLTGATDIASTPP